jgi:cytochrome c553
MLRRALIVCGLGAFAFGLPGCSILANKPAADTLAAAGETAYYTCDGCHGEKNVRVEFMSPKIIGQKKVYLAAKVRDFRDNKRLNPYMNGVVAEMTDQDIANLAAYYSDYGQVKK